VINPGMVLGPLLTDMQPSSGEAIKRMLNKEMSFIPHIETPLCDVRDVALAHYRAMTLPQAVNNRHLIVSKNDTDSLQQTAIWLNEEFSPKGYCISTKLAPDFLVKIIGLFDRGVAFLVPVLSKKPKFDNTRYTSVLGIKPIDTKKSVIDMAHSLIEKGLIPNYNKAHKNSS
jgi:nucleoside-diphosphate-sugar epimerase